MKVGFIGLGNVGGKLSGSLLRNGVDIYGHALEGQLLSTDTPERYHRTREAVADGSFVLP